MTWLDRVIASLFPMWGEERRKAREMIARIERERARQNARSRPRR